MMVYENWPKLKDKSVVGRWTEPNYELIAELNPDIVLCYARHPGPELERKLTPLGIRVLRLNFYKIHSLEREVEILGYILKRENEAKELIAWYRKNLNFIRERLKDIKDLPDVYIESYSDYHTAAPGSGGHEMCALAGGHNIASNLSIPYPEITPEWVLTKNPHVIIKAVAIDNSYTMTDPGPLKEVLNKVISRPAWDNIRAVRNGKVCVMSGDIWTGPRAIIGISYMAKWFHPKIFKDLDPKGLHREYMERFHGVKYKGVYVYPEIDGSKY